MFVSLTRTNVNDQPSENAAIVAEEMMRWLRDIEGFEGFLMLRSEDTAVGVSFWQSRDVAERHRAARMEFIHRMTSIAGVQVEGIEEFEVAFAELGPRLAAFTA